MARFFVFVRSPNTQRHATRINGLEEEFLSLKNQSEAYLAKINVCDGLVQIGYAATDVGGQQTHIAGLV